MVSVWLLHQNLIPNPASPEYKNQKVQKRIKNSSQAHLGWEPEGQRDKEGPPRFFSVESPHHWTCKLISPLSFVKMSPFVFLMFGKRWCYPELGCNSDD